MDKTTRNKLIISSSLILLLIGSKLTIDKEMSKLNERVISWGSTAMADDINFVAHRGYSSMYPDNSLEGLQACNDLKCIEGIECDVRLTKDGKLVLIHNEYIGLKHVHDFTYEELQEMDLSTTLTSRHKLFRGYNLKEFEILSRRFESLANSDYTLCTLEDVLRTRDKSKILFIDIKFSGYNDEYLMTRIAELVKGEENIIIQSFDAERLKEMAEVYPEYTYQLLIDTKKGLRNIDYEFDAYGIKFGLLEEDTETVEDLVDHDKQVSLWTVNSYSEFKQLVEQYGEYNDDIYYISDNPDMIGYQYSQGK